MDHYTRKWLDEIDGEIDGLYYKHKIEGPRPRILGENNCPAFSKTDSPCTDLFFSIVPGSSRESLDTKLPDAWNDDPDLTLKIIFNFGNVRKDGGGKQDPINFCRAMIWLWKNHPKTLMLNLEQIPEHASLKMLLDIFNYSLSFCTF